ncbi:Rossmann fold nucleotide-binding protein Smf possibly involved in DNA uptake [Leucobacter sp. 7(1)]|uniref:DNA-processing protein DprA n=1 Tax=Leucobacter sp. 7(1) TaxID=1255613 RepID=UPI00097E8429|nr:DNA-processing protein DprA [Leucobacter sp. 7(1)]SJN08761.1 Rossmann fold nucleotide-binding protein Smf possibly involved in DNA uptake [Leucobacter sp. 7(1)]
MDTINDLAADERTARIILAIASEPGDAVTGRMIRTVGASETVARVVSDAVPVGPDGDTWQRRLAPRINAEETWKVLAETERHGMRVLIPGDTEWPASIDALGDRAPVALWAKGSTALLAGPLWDRLTVTGARAATGYGEHVTTELVQSAVADSRVVLSGGAYGIDGAAHRAALTPGGSTVAVLAGGLDRPYPAGHADLLARVGKEGLLLSELPPGAAPTKWRFLARGRLLAALSGTVLIAEAGYRSGSLHTAARAIELGRPVGAVPGPLTSAASAGCHRLLRDGLGSIITGYDDVRELLHGARDGAHRAARERAGLEAEPLDQDPPRQGKAPDAPGL